MHLFLVNESEMGGEESNIQSAQGKKALKREADCPKQNKHHDYKEGEDGD